MLKSKRTFKISLILSSLFLISIILFFTIFSSYKWDKSFGYKLIKESILINNSTQTVYNYREILIMQKIGLFMLTILAPLMKTK